MRLHLGVDFGTSHSKLVLRNFEAPGGEIAYLLEPDGEFRISSALAFDDGKIWFAADPRETTSHKSLKMRFAGELKGSLELHFNGTALPIPYGLTCEDLVTLSVWRLISIGHLEAYRILKGAEFTMGMTLGIPMSFLDDVQLRDAFLLVARIAYRLYKSFGPIGQDSIDAEFALELLKSSRELVAKQPAVAGSAVRNWIRSETEASMYWSVRSPSIPGGPYFCIDIGAGTTDSNAFLITEAQGDEGVWRKDSLTFFGAHSISFAVDALMRLPAGQGDWGRKQIASGLVGAAQKAYARVRDNMFAVRQWEPAKLIILGGGSYDTDLRGLLCNHPMVNFRGTVMPEAGLEVPTDLKRTNGWQVKDSDTVFTSVAYGLAQLGLNAPKAAMPSEVQPVRPHGEHALPVHEEIYGD